MAGGVVNPGGRGEQQSGAEQSSGERRWVEERRAKAHLCADVVKRVAVVHGEAYQENVRVAVAQRPNVRVVFLAFVGGGLVLRSGGGGAA